MRISDWSSDVCSSDLEGDHVADRLGAGHQRGDAIDAEGDAAVRRRAVPERVEQEAELRLGLLRADAQQLAHRALHRRALVADRTAAYLAPAAHHAVSTPDCRPRIPAQVRPPPDRRPALRVSLTAG